MTPSSDTPRIFATTRWSLVLAAQQSATPEAQHALTDLCQLYWYPLYAYIRRCGYEAHEAEDLTQGFFARLLENEGLRRVTPTRGRFRSFLLTACRHFLASERERARAQKRGGGRVVSWDATEANRRYLCEPSDEASPERLFERRWALELLTRVLRRLREEYEGKGKRELFEALKGQLTGEGTEAYLSLGAVLQMSEGAVKTAVHRLRKRYAELLHEQIRETVPSEAEVEEELRSLREILSKG